MKLFVYVAVFIFIFLETAIAGHFPYYAMTLSFLGYMAYSKDVYSVFYAIPVAILIGMSSDRIEQVFIFFIVYVLVLNQVYRHILFDKVNIFLITVLQVAMYMGFLYWFRTKDIGAVVIIKESIFVLLYNYVFYYFERMKTSKD